MTKIELPKRTIEELIMLYEFEESITDIYVEGSFDKGLLEWYFETKDSPGVSIYRIDDVEINDFEMKEYYEKNNRDRILHLVEKLNETPLVSKYKGIIDKDILAYTRGLPTIRNVEITDYCCMEMYAFCPEMFQKMNKLCFNGKIKNVNKFMNDIKHITIKLSALSIFEKRRKFDLEKLSFEKSICIKNAVITFDFARYLRSVLEKNKLSQKYDEIYEAIVQIEKELSSDDPRNYINGHQMITAIRRILKKLHIINAQTDDEAIRNMFILTLEISLLDKYRLFHEITRFMKKECA